MLDLRSLVRIQDFSSIDLVAANATCSMGLPGIRQQYVGNNVLVVDSMSTSCARFTAQAMPLFHSGECDFPKSEGRFRVQAMITHLQRDVGVRYNRTCIPE